MSKRNERGLSLLEMIVVVSIIVFLGGVIYSTLSQGLALWKRATQNRPDLEIDLFFERLSGDLRNGFHYHTPIPFVGRRGSMELYTLVPAEGAVSTLAVTVRQPVRVKYSFDRQLRVIKRIEGSYPEILYLTKGLQAGRVLASQILNCEIQYYQRKPDEPLPVWRNSWEESCLPNAVKVVVDYKGAGRVKKVARIIPIPGGGCPASG